MGLTRFAAHDLCAFFEPAYGILRVDEARWKAAQDWEASTWAGAPKTQTTDRNDHHAALFGGYASVPKALGHVVELGCGPYTQVQSILQPSSAITSITLVDPLAAHYMARVKGCTYRDAHLLGRKVRVLSRVAEGFTLAHGILADTIIMIGLLQSVRDVPAVLQSAYNALRPGGLLIFADRVFDTRWDAVRGAGAKPFSDVGHPCSVKQTLLDAFLAGFEEIHARRFTKENAPEVGPPPGGAATPEIDEELYFIGRKLDPRATRTPMVYV